MSLKELVKKAMIEDADFRKKYTYWVYHRRKPINLNWLMGLLQDALGLDTVKRAAEEYVKGQSIES